MIKTVSLSKQFLIGSYVVNSCSQRLKQRLIKIIQPGHQPPPSPTPLQKIFEEFLNSDISLTKLAKKNSMTTAGIKKLLKNTTYLGKVKFAGIESQGEHKPLIEEDLFKKIQEKLR